EDESPKAPGIHEAAVPTADTAPGDPGFGAVLRYFLRLGTLGFGGPIAVVGYMQRDLVEQRGWVAKQDFLNGVALGQTMPGPLAAQVAPASVMQGPDVPDCQALRVKAETEWVPQMISILGIGPDDLPGIWDADFLFGPK